MRSWDAMVEINLTAPYLVTQAALPAITASEVGASVIFISSIGAGAFSSGWGTYAMTKNGLIAFMRCLADEVGAHGVRVNAICPGLGRDQDGAGYPPEHRSGFSASTMRPSTRRTCAANMLGALVTPDSVADIAVFLASDRARHITAQEHTVCGGCSPGNNAKPAEEEVEATA